jgi:hypothetical protein
MNLTAVAPAQRHGELIAHFSPERATAPSGRVPIRFTDNVYGRYRAVVVTGVSFNAFSAASKFCEIWAF